MLRRFRLLSLKSSALLSMETKGHDHLKIFRTNASMEPPPSPLAASFTEPEPYARFHAPKFTSEIAYSPFKLDFWQLGISFSYFEVRHSFLSIALLFSCLMCLHH